MLFITKTEKEKYGISVYELSVWKSDKAMCELLFKDNFRRLVFIKNKGDKNMCNEFERLFSIGAVKSDGSVDNWGIRQIAKQDGDRLWLAIMDTYNVMDLEVLSGAVLSLSAASYSYDVIIFTSILEGTISMLGLDVKLNYEPLMHCPVIWEKYQVLITSCLICHFLRLLEDLGINIESI